MSKRHKAVHSKGNSGRHHVPAASTHRSGEPFATWAGEQEEPLPATKAEWQRETACECPGEYVWGECLGFRVQGAGLKVEGQG